MLRTNLSVHQRFLVLSTFCLGTLITFGCAVIYSGVHQPRALTRASSNTGLSRAIDGRSPGESAQDEEKNATRTPKPVRNSGTGSMLSSAARSNAQLPGPQLPPGNTVRHPQSVTSPQSLERQVPPAQTAGTGASAKPEFSEQALATVNSTALPDLVPEQNTAVPVPERSAAATTVDRGTCIEVRLTDALSIDRNRTGDSFQAVLAAPLVTNGTVIAPEGSTVFGRVAEVHRASLLGRRAWVALTLASIKVPDGRVVQVSTTQVQKSITQNPIVSTTKLMGGAAFGTVKGALNGAVQGAGFAPNTLRQNPDTSRDKGRLPLLPAGTEISFNLVTPLSLAINAIH